MLKNIKTVLALALAVVLCLSFAGCHKANEIAVTAGNEQYTSGFYACALVNADLDARQKVEDALGSTDANTDYYSQKVEGKDYITYVKETAINTLKEMSFYKAKCEEEKINMDSAIQNAESSADFYWNSYGFSQLFEPNGVSAATFKKYSVAQCYKQAYFEHLYGEKGTKAVSSDTINKFIEENNVYANFLSADITDKKEDEIKKIKDKFEAYKKRINKGENFGKIYDEYNNSDYYDDKADTSKTGFNSDFASILGTDKSNYQSDYYEYAKSAKIGVAEVVTTKKFEDGKSAILLILKGDIFEKNNTYLDALKTDALQEMKGDEFAKDMAKGIDGIAVKENTYATGQFKVKKIVYPEGY